eukprot:jgi/Bigna1/130823/aug1.12_g5531
MREMVVLQSEEPDEAVALMDSGVKVAAIDQLTCSQRIRGKVTGAARLDRASIETENSNISVKGGEVEDGVIGPSEDRKSQIHKDHEGKATKENETGNGGCISGKMDEDFPNGIAREKFLEAG